MPQQATHATSAHTRSAFLSHSSADAELAQQFCACLEAQGVKCWIAPRDLIPGNPYPEEIVRGIELTQALILLATPAAVASEDVLNEVEQAHRLHKKLLTVMIGKPEISRQLSYYIARLHWIEASGASLPGVAERLAQAIQGASSWESVATRPSVTRFLSYGIWRAFAIHLVVAAALIVATGLIGFHLLRSRLSADYRGLAWVTLDGARDEASNTIRLGLRLWLANDATRGGDLGLRCTLRQSDQAMQSLDLAPRLDPQQAGNQQAILFSAPSGTAQITTCVTVPGPSAGQKYRVTQSFSLAKVNDAATVGVSPSGEPSVKQEDGTPCQAP